MNKEFYAEYFEVEDRHWWFLGRRRVLLSLLERFLPEGASRRRIVDIGCGTGTMLSHLSRFGVTEGADGDPEAVRFCKERGYSDIQTVRLPLLPYDDASFDLVTLLDVLEHVDEDLETLESVLRVLRPGGIFLLAVPAYRFLWGRQDEISLHKRRYVITEIRDLLRRAGFETIKLSYFNTFLFPFIAVIRILRPFRPGVEAPQSDFSFPTPRWVNALLAAIFGSESVFLQWVNFPFGVSICAVARKPALSAG